VNRHGVEKILHPDYTVEEKAALLASGKALKEKLSDLPK
jgi:hypothetical protein